MTKLEAIKLSIVKWELIVSGQGLDRGQEDCVLCQEYDAHHCAACPIRHLVEDSGCRSTPYVEWRNHHKDVHESIMFDALAVQCDECKTLAQAELNFLRALLKREENAELSKNAESL